jgi:hypothetical protein
LDVFLDGQGRLFGGGVQQSGEEEVGCVFGSIGAAGLLFFLNLEFINSLQKFLFREENAAAIAHVGDFQLFGVVLFEVESDTMGIVGLGFRLSGDDLLGGVLGFLGLFKFFEAEFLLSFSYSFVGGQIGLDF